MSKSIKKPGPSRAPQPARLCPVCGKSSYSRGGIHPQCAVEQADAHRKAQLRKERAKATKVVKPPRRSWTKKCPKCEAEVHVRRASCDCGYGFGA